MLYLQAYGYYFSLIGWYAGFCMKNLNQTVFMSGTEYFDAAAPINPFMDTDTPIDREQAHREHAQIKGALEQAGVKVIQIDLPENCQDACVPLTGRLYVAIRQYSQIFRAHARLKRHMRKLSLKISAKEAHKVFRYELNS